MAVVVSMSFNSPLDHLCSECPLFAAVRKGLDAPVIPGWAGSPQGLPKIQKELPDLPQSSAFFDEYIAMTGINGIHSADITSLVAASSQPPKTQEPGKFDLTMPAPPPADVEGMPPGELYDTFVGYVNEFGSQEIKDELAAGHSVELFVYVDGEQDPLYKIELDPTTQTATLTAVSEKDNNTLDESGVNEASPIVTDPNEEPEETPLPREEIKEIIRPSRDEGDMLYPPRGPSAE